MKRIFISLNDSSSNRVKCTHCLVDMINIKYKEGSFVSMASKGGR